MIQIFLSLECNGIETHLLDHGEQTVAARRRQIFGKSYAVYEIEVGAYYLVGGVAVENFNEKRYYAFDNYRIGIGSVIHCRRDTRH